MTENHLITDRRKKIANWEEKGFAGYAQKFDRTHTAEKAKKVCENGDLREANEILENPSKATIYLCGRIINLREMGKLAFLKIRDVTGDFQVCFAKNILGDDFKWFIKNLDLGDFCGFAGEFFITKHGEPTLMATEITPLSKSIRPMPVKWEGLADKETCYRERNLDLMTNPETFDRFKKRSQAVQEIRNFFHEKNFLEVETRILQPQAGGAMAKTFNTHHNALDQEFVLRISLELDLKMCVGGGMERIFEIGKNFRNEGTDPSHLQEFTMIEWYAAYKDINTNKEWMEDLIHRVCENVYGKTKFEILDKNEEKVEVDFGGKFASVDFADLLKDYAGIDMFTISDENLRAEARKLGVEDVEKRSRGNLLDDIYKHTARPHLIQPTFVMNWPSDLKPLARPNGNGTSDVYQLLVAGWEIVNAYGELINPAVQRKLFEEQAKAKAAGDDEAMEIDEVFLKTMEYGFPPMTGTGMGIDRLCALLSGMPNLRDVVLFPTMKPENAKKNIEKKAETKTADATKETTEKIEVKLELIDGVFNRAKAFKMIEANCDFALQRHLAHVAAAMEALAVKLGHDDQKEDWFLTGLLHDIDWNQTINNSDYHCGKQTINYLKESGVPEEICNVIETHNMNFGLPVNTDFKKALLACDEISGFAVAVALMRPTKMMGMAQKSINKKMKDKKFAAAVSREEMKSCEKYFDIPVAEFLQVLIPAWEGIAKDWELV